MISPETRAEIRRYFYAEHWKIGTIARELGVHPDAVRNAIEAQRFNAQPLRTSMADPYLAFIRQTLDQHPRLRATRIYHMVRDRGYTGSVVQLRRAVARLRPQIREPFLRLETFPGLQAQVDWAQLGIPLTHQTQGHQFGALGVGGSCAAPLSQGRSRQSPDGRFADPTAGDR